MGPPSYMRSVVDRNVVMRRMTVYLLLFHCNNGYTNEPFCDVMRTLPVVLWMLTLRHVFTRSTYLPFFTASSYAIRF